jgi:aspartyl-tRNA(Asn)/glutamyl-tRNA(Gln) amidotransferase subunit A
VLGPEQSLRQALASGQGQAHLHRPLAGLPVSVKDLFDVAGQVTRAGSVVLEGQPPAASDSAAVSRIRAAGGLIAGRTNMTEFAFSGVGINPHYGTPVNPADPQVQRIAGGSSSGAAVTVAAGAAVAGLGSDTGGSLRIPAALCGLVGFKSTARLVPTEGTVPLSTTLDTVGAITRSVRDAIVLHEILAARRIRPATRPLRTARLAVARTWMLEDMQAPVAQAFENSLALLRSAGAALHPIDLGDIADLAQINAAGGFSAAQSHAWHRQLLARDGDRYDSRVAKRILRGASMSAADYIDLLHARRHWIDRMEAQLAGFDAVVSPTVPLLAPEIAPLEHDEEQFFKVNALLLRNTSVVNMLDGCAISVPCHDPGQLPVGLMFWHGALHDEAVLGLALQFESLRLAAR